MGLFTPKQNKTTFFQKLKILHSNYYQSFDYYWIVFKRL